MRLIEDVFYYTWTDLYENNCNSYYIGGSVNALIDPGLKHHVPSLLKKMASDGIRREDIRYVINTHCHPDHFEGAEAFCSPGIEIAMHQSEISFYEEIGAQMFDWFGLDRPKIDITLPLSEGEIMLGGETFQIALIPGHSPGSIGLFWPTRGVSFLAVMSYSSKMWDVPTFRAETVLFSKRASKGWLH